MTQVCSFNLALFLLVNKLDQLWALRCFDTVFLGPYPFESALRQSSPCQINVKFAILVSFGLNFGVVYIL